MRKLAVDSRCDISCASTAQSGEALFTLCNVLMFEGPNGKLRSIREAKLAEDAVQVLLNGPFREMQVESDLLIQFGLKNKVYNLIFPEAERWTERLVFVGTGLPAGRTDSVPTILLEFATTAATVSEGNF